MLPPPPPQKRVYRKKFNDDEVIDVDSIEDKVNDPGKGTTHVLIDSDDDVGFGWKNHNVHGDSDDSNDSFNGNDDDKINDENFIGNMNYVVPCVGMIFDSLDEGGRSGPKTLEVEDRVKGKQPRDVIPRTCCRARMCVAHKVSSNKWEVTKVNLDYNHAMVTSDRVQFMQRSRNIDPFTRSLIELLNKSGIETPKVMNLLSETCGGIEKVGFSAQYVRNVIRDIQRRVFDSGDAECGLVLLRDLQKQSDGNFFYRVDVDEENRVRGLVWVDPRSLNAYKNFGEVVTFDSTYRTNRYDMPFIPITGVNHHYQNIFFGFALVRDEKETSYRWVLNTWLEAVDNKPPITIITDQDIALSNSIAEVMPNTNHTYCTCHISSKFSEKLSTLYTQYLEFKTDFNACIYKLFSPKEFEGRWEDLKEKYDLENHNWLNDMYAIRR
ncbi:protein FAR1-RELATED SEQUENCE 5-like [Apium graveolens]|uniref:protein FAR1-RELATED SEQUENCE 5-like n=1 Tax=Apium graveolens TaxID=4045 RepID=UPI003D7A2C1D